MNQRRLGKNGPLLNPIGLGCMGMSEFYGPSDEQTSIQVIHRALEVGVTHFDTADMYGVGHNEELLGRALKGRRDQAFLATKFAVVREGGGFGISGKPEYVKAACDKSLKRLGVDHIDLYYQHRVDQTVPIEDTIGAMAELVKAGKVRFLGMSEAKPETIRRAYTVHPITALQTEFSLWSREPEEQLIPLCQELGMAFVAYSPLSRGFLSGQIKSPNDLAPNDFRRYAPRFEGDNFAKNLELVRAVETFAEKKRATPAQVAIAWVLAKSDHVFTIPGTRKIARLEENAAALKIELSKDELATLENIGRASGARYPEAAMKSLNG